MIDVALFILLISLTYTLLVNGLLLALLALIRIGGALYILFTFLALHSRVLFRLGVVLEAKCAR